MDSYVLGLHQVDRTRRAEVGGKGAQLGELTRVAGISVPPAVCVTTHAYRRALRDQPALNELLTRLSRLDAADAEAIAGLSAAVRRRIQAADLPEDVATAITAALGRLGEDTAYAVRSSATTEDSPTSSFAGQQDSFLNVVGSAAVLQHVRRCWASAFTERAVTYRLRNGEDHRAVAMGVVVQRLVRPHASGVLFTADPVTSNRRVAAVEATLGLGEALVAGRVNADAYAVRDGAIVSRAIASKRHATLAVAGGGTREELIAPALRQRPALTDAQVLQLVRLGRRIEAHFGCPQDIEWCLADDGFQIVQSRPITTLFPVPKVADGGKRVYVSVGHQQMMTDPMRPLGLSVWLLTTRAPMQQAGGRLFVDVTQALASPATRAGLVAGLGRSDPLIGDALRTVVERGFLPPPSADDPAEPPAWAAPADIPTEPTIVTELIARSQASLAALRRDLATRAGVELIDFILGDLEELRRLLSEPQSRQAVMAGMQASWELTDRLQEWLGETSAVDLLTQSVPHNVTSEMGRALLDVADVIRPHPAVVAYLRDVEQGQDFLDELAALEGGVAARDAIRGYLEQYGMRCVGEIDITRPRWSERPTALLPLILSNIDNFAPGAAGRHFEQGLRQAQHTRTALLERLRRLPEGESKAAEAARLIDRLRTFIGYREYPKYAMISRYFLYKQALLSEADRLVDADVLGNREDIFFLTLPELREVVRTRRVDQDLLRRRRAEFRAYHALSPPRVLTSEGEAIAGTYRRADAPPGALVGLPVSAGTVQGRARVISDMAQADLAPGDILVTAFTDPSWSPLFVTAAGLVTEVGGQMTHGAVIAREYGLPAVVGVEHATRLIRDGQQIRVYGTDGYVQILPGSDPART